MDQKLTKLSFLNYSILIPYIFLSSIGIIMVFSTTVPYELSIGDSPYRMTITQGIFMLLSFVMLAIIYRMKLQALKSKKLIFYTLVILLIAMIYSRFGPGTEVNGAHRWIQVPGIGTIQPAEYAKIFIVWYLASVFSEKQDEIYQKDIKALFKGDTLYKKVFGGWRFPIVAMIVIEIIMPDLGSTVMMVVISGCMIGISGVSWQWFSSYGKFFLLTIIGFIIFLYSVKGNVIPGHYVNARFRAMVDPFSGLGSYGHQMANSYYAVSNGGWFGRGLGNSIQKNGFLPEAHTDFIFAIVIEELGVVGGIIILAVFFFMVARILQVGINSKKPFNSMISMGIAVTLLISIFVNVGGAFGIIPESGVTFPFISQGGSSFLVLSIGIGFVLNVSADERRNEILKLSQVIPNEVTKVSVEN
ncbi:FtsW/RodA/SpoVE family cell cycle protein [Lactococcus petauri]|uniref:FtsW/RodA/SpoVE family cell cycle protein n=2 Tax=Lactococcus petauri TaxID=1940789 RepID=UPI0020784C01|nr:FtsW/RodA/SpoVE family cell cycle protein [Lactococcus petauri]USI67587.1 FtsW/RodA/SpoVE family cell cycle protein [Lactococcus petauri]WJE12248.1 FtsW/RodA/SpoVE family cell cycle protein [Lactococcus petauri]